jgi:membrane associated rhomboid family serine protease
MSVADPWVVVLESRDLRQADEAGFVLRAIGIEHALSRLEGYWQVSVPALRAVEATEQLAAYRDEASRAPRGRPVHLDELGSGWAGVAAYAGVLLLIAVAANQDLFGLRWMAVGRLDTDRVLTGEWWRTVTALCLHVDTAHLAGNLAFGGFFGLYAGRYLGSGVAWLSIIAAGALGNGLNALIQPSGHLAVGASTAVFAALGLLAAYTWRRGYLQQSSWKARIAPVTAAIGLLAFLGTGGGADGGEVDIIAHLTGFVAGFGFGCGLAAVARPLSEQIQIVAALAATALLVGAWLWGFVAG